jgi:hypothetical protein
VCFALAETNSIAAATGKSLIRAVRRSESVHFEDFLGLSSQISPDTALPIEATLALAKGTSAQRTFSAAVEDKTDEKAVEEHDPPEPILELREKVKVYIMFASKLADDRDTQMMREGIQMHPFIELIGEGPGDTQEQKDAAAQADFILYPMLGDIEQEDCTISCPALLMHKMVPKEKLAVLDFSDGTVTRTPPAQIVFKRSMVDKVDGSFAAVSKKCSNNMFSSMPAPEQPICFPIDYAIRPDDFNGLTSKSMSEHRKFAVVYLVQPYENLKENLVRRISAVRLRVKQWLSEMPLPNASFVGFKRHSGEKFKQADIVIVVDPAAYEGQHALYEALGSGAVVLANKRWVPMPYPLEDEKHVHYFDTCSTDDAKRAFHEKIKELLSQPSEERNAFRLQAWKHGLRYHQAANRMDYVVKTMLEWKGKTPVIPQSLKISPDSASLAYMQERCIAPTKKLVAEGKLFTTYPYLTGGNTTVELLQKNARLE